MRKNWRKINLIAALVTLVGLLFASIGYLAHAKPIIYENWSGFHVDDLKPTKMVSKTLDPFTNISCSLGNMDISIVPSDHYAVETKIDSSDGTVTDMVENGTLVLKRKNGVLINRISLDPIRSFPGSYVKIYVPSGAKFDSVGVKSSDAVVNIGSVNCRQLTVSGDYGDITVSDVTSETASIKSGNADVQLTHLTADTLGITGSYGDTKLTAVSTKSLSLQSGNMDISQSGCSFGTAKIKLSYGTLNAAALKAGGLTITGDNADITLSGAFTGATKISSSYGTVKLTTAQQESAFSSDLSASYGTIHINGKDYNSRMLEKNSSPNSLTIKGGNSDININFAHAS